MMPLYKMTYSSMSAYYDLGYCEAESKEEAERITRRKQTAFSEGEKSLITGRKVSLGEVMREKEGK
jgi:hypothetical protein